MGEAAQDGRLDRVRVWGLLLIVATHAEAATFWNAFEVPAWWWPVSLMDALAHAGVPLFIMASGAIYLRRCDDAGAFYARRAVRVLLPLMFWSAVMVAFAWSQGRFAGWRDTGLALLDGGVYYHLWFLYPLLALYLLTPALQRATRRQRAWGAAVALVLTVVLFGVSLRVPIAQVVPLSVSELRYFIFYFVAGDVLSRCRIGPRHRWMAALVCLACTVAAAVATYALSLSAGRVDASWFRYDSPLVILNALACFTLLMGCRAPLSPLGRRLCDWSFGIYLVHAWVLALVQDVGWRGYRLSATQWLSTPQGQADAWQAYPVPLLGVVLLMVVVLAGSSALVALIRCVPGLRRVVG